MARAASKISPPYGAVLRSLALASVLLFGPTTRAEQVVGNGEQRDEPITPIPTTADTRPDRIRLGERLFSDARLSRDSVVACSACHHLATGGDDDRALATGLDGRPLDFNTPTIFNVGLNARFDWRGNFRSLEEQNESALLDPRVMHDDWNSLLSELRADATYREAFAASYGGEINRGQVLDALATYERSLVTPNGRFDRHLRGETGAITADEERGYQLFKSYGCIACHQGVNVGGNLFQQFGIFHDPFVGRPVTTEADLGRFTITGDPADRHVFRVPSLRNVALTAPYFHDGSAPTLNDAVEIMARNQLGRTLTRDDIGLIVKFLNTLTGDYQGRSLADRTGNGPQ
jgi:cytochrome c peroxidase